MDRLLIPVRMTPEDKAKVAAAANRQRLSMNAFMVRAALVAAAGNGQARPAEALSPEAQDALAALIGAGYSRQEARTLVLGVLERHPQATAGEILETVFKRAV